MCWLRRNNLAGRYGCNPILIRFECRDETLKPAVGVAMIVSPRPDAEFFHVVAHGCDAAGMLAGGVAEKFDDLVRRAKGNEIPKGLETGNQTNGLSLILGNECSEELAGVESSVEEVVVVDESIFHSRGGKNRGQLRLPNTLGEPRAARALSKMKRNIIRQALNLLTRILSGDSNQNWLVKTAAQEFYLSALDKSFQILEIFRMSLFEPFQQPSRIVQADAKKRMTEEQLNKRQIGFLVGVLDYGVEIAVGLVRVNQKDEIKTSHVHASACKSQDTRLRRFLPAKPTNIR